VAGEVRSGGAVRALVLGFEPNMGLDGLRGGFDEFGPGNAVESA